jgi:glutaredoxin 2
MKLYSYDHCPYCVKARMIFGIKGVPFTLVTLLNDDEQTPISMIGQKMLPILEKDDGSYMPESMDIVHYVDGLSGAPAITAPGKQHEAVTQWLAEARGYLYQLTMPRWVKAGLEEFATQGAVDYFTGKKEGMIGSFEEHLENSPYYVAEADTHLKKLEPLLSGEEYVHAALSEDDFHVFAALRSLTIAKGIVMPKKVGAYLAGMAKKSGVPLYEGI